MKFRFDYFKIYSNIRTEVDYEYNENFKLVPMDMDRQTAIGIGLEIIHQLTQYFRYQDLEFARYNRITYELEVVYIEKYENIFRESIDIFNKRQRIFIIKWIEAEKEE